MSTLACVTATRTDSREIHPGSNGLAALSRFRQAFYGCLSARSDELFELTEAVLCTDGPVKTLVDLALAPEHRRGHGALYDGLNHGRIEFARLRKVLAALPLPRAADGRIVLAADVSPWLRPDAATCPDRSFCHTYGRGKNEHRMIPGWPCSIIAALETGRTSWTAMLDAIRLEPGADVAALTARQLREVVTGLIEAGQHQVGDPDILIVIDAGYDVPRLAFLLAELPVEILGRMRSNRVMRRPAPPAPSSCAPAPAEAARPSTAPSSSSATRPPGATPRRRPSPTPPGTAPRTPKPSTGSTLCYPPSRLGRLP
ncbi:transposase [Nonomuraea antimicrobica]